MWIRSANKKVLVNTEDIYIYCNNIKSGDRDCTLGEYDSSERALEVLDQIHNVIARNISRDYLSGKYRVNQNYVFQMPEE